MAGKRLLTGRRKRDQTYANVFVPQHLFFNCFWAGDFIACVCVCICLRVCNVIPLAEFHTGIIRRITRFSNDLTELFIYLFLLV